MKYGRLHKANQNRFLFFITMSVLLTVHLLVSGCNFSEQALTEDEVLLRDTTLVARDGEAIACTIGGSGSYTLLFVHGWCIDKSYWDEQMLHFGKKARVVAIDLPGFGQSGKGRMEYSIPGYARDIRTVIRDLNLKNVILVGHSVAGAIILEAALAMPDVVALVGVDTFKNINLELDSAMAAEVDRFMKMLKEDYAEIATNYAHRSLFAPSTNPAIKDRVLESIRSANPKIAIGFLRAAFAYSKIEKKRLAKLDQKLYLINTETPETDKEALRALDIDFEIYSISKSGHYPMIERPLEFDKILDAILTDIQGVLAQKPFNPESGGVATVKKSG